MLQLPKKKMCNTAGEITWDKTPYIWKAFFIAY